MGRREGRREAPGEAAQGLELWPGQKPDEPSSLKMDRVSQPEEDGKEEVKTVGERKGREKGPGRAGGSRVAGTLRSLTFAGSVVLAGWFLEGETVREKKQSGQVCWEQQGRGRRVSGAGQGVRALTGRPRPPAGGGR